MLFLEGIKVIDMTQFLSASYCAEILGDLGADVIKIERPVHGEVYRNYGPKFINGESVSYLALNRNKRSLSLNIKEQEGQEILINLVKSADVFVENFRVGTLAKYGLDYESLKHINPRLIYCSISGFGQDGPYASKGGFDLIAQAMSGIMYVTGEQDGVPVKVGYPVTDIGAGLYGAIGVLSSIIARQKTGVGCFVDTSLFEVGASWGMIAALSYFADGSIQERMGSASPQNAPYQAFTVSDGAFTMGTGNETLWERFCEIFELNELLENDLFKDNSLRVKNQRLLSEIIEQKIKHLSVSECIERLDNVGIPCGVINSIDKVVDDPQIKWREMLVEFDHPVAGIVKNLAFPVHFNNEICSPRLAPPLLGEHTREILIDLGYSDSEINDFEKKKVIQLK